MKLQSILEMAAYATKSAHIEYTDVEINQAKNWLLQSGIRHQIEDGKFFVIHKENSIGLFNAKTDEVLGWITLKPIATVFGATVIPLGNIQILPKFRNTVAVLVLVNAARTLLDHPVYVDDPIFQGGEKLLQALARRPGLPSVTVIDKKTGICTPYSPSALHTGADIGILLEQVSSLAFKWADLFPGGEKTVIVSLFEQFHGELGG